MNDSGAYYAGNFQQERLDAAKKRSQAKAKQSFLKVLNIVLALIKAFSSSVTPDSSISES